MVSRYVSHSYYCVCSGQQPTATDRGWGHGEFLCLTHATAFVLGSSLQPQIVDGAMVSFMSHASAFVLGRSPLLQIVDRKKEEEIFKLGRGETQAKRITPHAH